MTHDQTEAMTLGDRVAVMRGGVLQQVDTPRELYERPANLFVAGFIGSPAMNFLPGDVDSDSIGPRWATSRSATSCAAPGAARLGRQGGHRRHASRGLRGRTFAPRATRLQFDATIELTESMGSEIYAHFDFEGGDDRREELRELQRGRRDPDVPGSASGHAVARVDANSTVKAGARSRLWLNVQKLHLFDPSDGASMTRAPDTSTDAPASAPA